MFSRLNLAQKILFLALLGLLMLMVVFSFNVRKYLGQEGYNRCIQEKCEINKEYCQKSREIGNCCEGAGGKTAISGGQLGCIFE